MQTGCVIQCAHGSNHMLTRHHHSNPILDMRTYEVEFPDGRLHEDTANLIADKYVFNV